VLVGAVETRLKEIVYEVAKELMVEIIDILAGVHPQLGVNTFVKKVKGRSSRLLRSEFPSLKTRLPTLWTNSYFVSTVGGAPLEVVKQYIENQQLSERDNDRSKWSRYMDSVNHG
jgi:putative transposase